MFNLLDEFYFCIIASSKNNIQCSIILKVIVKINFCFVATFMKIVGLIKQFYEIFTPSSIFWIFKISYELDEKAVEVRHVTNQVWPYWGWKLSNVFPIYHFKVYILCTFEQNWIIPLSTICVMFSVMKLLSLHQIRNFHLLRSKK